MIDNGSQVEGNQPQQPFRGKSSYPQQNFRKRKGRTICLNYINPFPRRERQWQRPVSTGYKPSGTEPICSDGVLQDGDPPSGKGTHSTWRLHDEVGPEGCLLYSTNLPRTLPVPPLLVPRDPLRVSMPAVWPFICTSSLYKDPQTGSDANTLIENPTLIRSLRIRLNDVDILRACFRLPRSQDFVGGWH